MPDGLRGPVQGRALMGVSEGLEVGVSEWSRLEPGTRQGALMAWCWGEWIPFS